eukprot:TRINITY_DN3199_c0_g1_i1.p1 TRINITY_DN3199_c0_g1~~TRINITY_DN3199_c0_g1_i1.p1  ORF type:complete len:1227 (+),score=343.84 TRINITY_DN3199_c0_g1_i1:493-4173(+)
MSIAFGLNEENSNTVNLSGFTIKKCVHSAISLTQVNVIADDLIITDNNLETSSAFSVFEGQLIMTNTKFLNNVVGGNMPGALDLQGCSNVTIGPFVEFKNNSGSKTAGAVIISGVANCLFINVTAEDNSALRAGFAEILESEVVFNGTNFINNNADKTGGVIVAYQSVLRFFDSNFDGATTSSMGGAIFAKDCYTLTFVNVYVNNIQSQLGGFLYGQDIQQAVVFDNCFINNSRAVGVSGQGGAIYLAQSAGLKFMNSTLSKVQSQRNGGIYLEGTQGIIVDSSFIGGNSGVGSGIFAINTELQVTGSTFKNNNASTGGAIGVSQMLKVVIEDSLFEENTVQSCFVTPFGGAISLYDNPSVLISKNDFISNKALNCSSESIYEDTYRGYGGVIGFIGNNNVEIEKCNFRKNFGTLGGVFSRTSQGNTLTQEVSSVSTHCLEENSKLVVDTSSCEFTENVGSAGSIYYTTTKIYDFDSENILEIHQSTNKCEYYGNIRATQSKKLSLLSKERGLTEDYEPSVDVQIGVLDEFDSLVTIPQKLSIGIHAKEAALALRAKQSVQVIDGIGHFEEVVLIGSPDTYHIFASAINHVAVEFEVTVDFCSPGEGYSEEDKRCISCVAGEFSSDSSKDPCQTCPVGQWSYSERAKQCIDCPIGTYRSEDMVGCQPCPSGHYTPDTGSSSCLSCPSTKVSSPNRDSCVCKGGMFPVELSNGTTSCERCPEGLLCFGYDDYCVKEGYWQSNDTKEVFKCVNEGCAGTCQSKLSPELESSYCNEGHTGSMCESCMDGYFMLEPRCEQCYTNSTNLILLGISVVFWIFIFVSIAADVNNQIQIVGYYKPLIRYFQIVASVLTTSSIPFPYFLRMTLLASQLLFLDVSRITLLLCNFGLVNWFPVRFWTSFFTIPVIWGLIFGVSMIRKCIGKWDEDSKRRMIQNGLILTHVFFGSVIFGVLPIFACQDVGSSNVLSIDSNTTCYTAEWYSMAIPAGLLLATWVVISFMYLRNVKNENIKKEDVLVERNDAPYLAPYKSPSPFFEVAEELICMLLISGLLLTARGTAFQAALGMCLSFAAIALHIQHWSFMKIKQNRLQLIYLVAILLLFIFGLIIRLGNSSGVELNDIYAIIVALVLIVIGGIGLFHSIKAFATRKLNTSGQKYKTHLMSNQLRNPLAHLQDERLRKSSITTNSNNSNSDENDNSYFGLTFAPTNSTIQSHNVDNLFASGQEMMPFRM